MFLPKIEDEHEFEIGQVVILNTWGDEWCCGNVLKTSDGKEISTGIKGKVKLIVVGHHRDCDGTPLYMLSSDAIGFIPEHKENIRQHHTYKKWVDFFIHAISEDSLDVCFGEKVEMKYNSIFEYEDKVRRDLASLYEGRNHGS